MSAIKCTVIVMGERRVPLPSELLEELEDAGTKAAMGYATTAEAVKDAIRNQIERLRAVYVNQRFKHEQEAAEVEG